MRAIRHPEKVDKLVAASVAYDMEGWQPASRLAILPATAHTAVINQPELLQAVIEPFLAGEKPKEFFE